MMDGSFLCLCRAGQLVLALGVVESGGRSDLVRPNSRLSVLLSHASQTKQQISLEESTFFSVGEDGALCCWDEYDRSER